MYSWIRRPALLIMLIISVAGCDKFAGFSSKKESKTPASIYKGPVVAKVNDRVITLEKFNRRFQNLLPEEKELYEEGRQGKERLLEDLIRRELLFQEALARGLDREDEIRQALADFKEELLVGELINRETKKIDISPQEIQQYYEFYKDELKEPQEIRLRQIVVKSEEEAKDILIKILEGADFAELARQYSVDPTAKDGGDLGFVEPGQLPQPIEQAAFALDIGGVSNIIRAEGGFYIIKLEEKKGGRQLSVYEVQDDIKNLLLLQKQNEMIMRLTGDLKKVADIEIHPELLE
jgi:peptidyl-prolyl cis-trans isomerase C